MHIYQASAVIHEHPVEIVVNSKGCEPELSHEVREGLAISRRDGDVEVLVLARLVSEQSVDTPTSV
jgi:hypothetical protein